MEIQVGIIKGGKIEVCKLIIDGEVVAYSKHSKVIQLYIKYIEGEDMQFPIGEKAEKVLKPYREKYLRERNLK